MGTGDQRKKGLGAAETREEGIMEKGDKGIRGSGLKEIM